MDPLCGFLASCTKNLSLREIHYVAYGKYPKQDEKFKTWLTALAKQDDRLDEIYSILYGKYPAQEEEYLAWLEVLLDDARQKKPFVA